MYSLTARRSETSESSGRRAGATALLVLASALLITACSVTGSTLRLLVTDHHQVDPDALQAVFEKQSSLRFELAEAPGDMTALEALVADRADLALVENNVPFRPGVRAILPVFESVLHLAVRDAFYASNPRRTMEGARFYVANRSAAGRTFVDLVMQRAGFGPDQYRISSQFEAGETDFILYFGPINPDNTSWLREGFSLVSLDNRLNPRRKFYEQGIGYNAPGMKPRTIPALTYDLPGNEEALLTVAVDTLLVTRVQASEASIYQLTRTFLEQKPRLTAIAPHLFAGINASFDPLDLSFPLHRGARSYLNRDDPGFVERYAETINMLVYVSVLVVSAFLALARWREHRKKDRVDVFYRRVFEVRDAGGETSAEQKLQQLDAIEREAFESLISEKLSANESFRIFTDLLARTREEIRERQP
ncbi:TAXI family TRAP transporter solute-binding subunit [Seongchinamella sediminis]|uniref:TAXI family TRAP transporter solute-binding subunit n=1 Tax=Seongchinamella sediminis TaxID=2283635 RepID=UPI001058D8CE|nr:TAXI family TRAP transporter solute-binding subunit [Seongchinamella sediminis]